MKTKKQSVVSTPQPRLLTIKQAAAYLSSAVWLVRTLLWEKRVPFLKLGNKFLIDKSDLDTFVENKKVSARS